MTTAIFKSSVMAHECVCCCSIDESARCWLVGKQEEIGADRMLYRQVHWQCTTGSRRKFCGVNDLYSQFCDWDSGQHDERMVTERRDTLCRSTRRRGHVVVCTAADSFLAVEIIWWKVSVKSCLWAVCTQPEIDHMVNAGAGLLRSLSSMQFLRGLSNQALSRVFCWCFFFFCSVYQKLSVVVFYFTLYP